MDNDLFFNSDIQNDGRPQKLERLRFGIGGGNQIYFKLLSPPSISNCRLVMLLREFYPFTGHFEFANIRYVFGLPWFTLKRN